MSRPLHMRHNFPVIEALEAAGIDRTSVEAITPLVDLDRLLVREATSWFEKLVLRNNSAIAFPHVVYMHTSWYRRPRAEVVRLVIHEAVHVSQWRTTGTLRFAVTYSLDYLRGRARRRGHSRAYEDIRYEVAARDATDKVLPR